MPSSIHLSRVMRRYWRLAAVAVALLGIVAVIATVNAAGMGMGEHDHGGGHGQYAVVVCVALGGCALAVAVAAAAAPRLTQRGVWSIPAPSALAMPWVPAVGRFLARAGPPPLLQVFRL